MIALAAPLTIGLSLTHPNVFGIAWYLLIIICVGITLREWASRSKTASAHSYEHHIGLSSWPIWKIWLLAFGPLTIISITSIFVHDLRFGRAEVIEIFLGGLVFAIAFKSEHLKINLAALPVGATVAGLVSLLVTIYESTFRNLTRVGDDFNPINYGIACGSILLILAFWIVLQNKPGSTPAFSKPRSSWSSNSWILGIAAFGSGFALLHTGSRGPMIAFIFSMAGALASHEIRRKVASLSKILKLGLAAILAIFLLRLALTVYSRLMDTLLTGNQSSDGVRWQLILIAIEQIQKSPLLGIGADQAGALYAALPPPISDFNHAHVTLLNLALELGLPGALGWIWAFGVFALIFSPWRTPKDSLASIIGFWVCAYFFVCSMTQDVLSHSYTRKYIALVLPMLLAIRLANRHKHA